ncbi:MAG: site-2 protease family protein [Mycobacteriaceae bacterium]
MVFAFGVVLFALGIAVSIALHELGHLVIAKSLGMKVRRYFIGFGPKVFSFRRGETEYGLKAIPAGGFCDIAGMTALDEVTADELPRAMYRQKAWKRIAVMMGGPITHFVLGIVLVYVVAVGYGLPNIGAPTTAVVDKVTCAAPTQLGDTGNPATRYTLPPCTPSDASPAAAAGLLAGDVITAVNGTSTPTFADVVAATQPLTGSAAFTVDRGGRSLVLQVAIAPVQRYVNVPDGKPVSRSVGAIGVEARSYGPIAYTPASAVIGSVAFTGRTFVKTVQGLLDLPQKVPAVFEAIGGGQRGADTPISVVGASRIGGEIAEQGQWQVFLLLLALLNFFIGVFNLLPLLPLDGGHMAVTVYEKLRNTVRLRRGRAIGAPVDYTKLLPLTYVVILLGGGLTLLTVTADIVNPIQLFQ